ncbi:hypothetical protein VPH35_025807 [Triticum aestivum]
MLPDDTLPLWLDHDETLSLLTGAQKATIARAEADRAEARGSLQPFALRLNKRLADDHAGRSGNLAFSPLSVYVALSMAATGARQRTLDELLGAPSRHDLTWYVCTLAEQALADRSRTGGPRVSFACRHRLQGGCPLPAPIYSMFVFLPDALDGLWRLIDMIACDPEFLRKHLPRSDVEVGEFRLPKLKVSFGMTMNGILRGMGLKEAFEPGKADLSDVTEDGPRERRRLEQVVHRAIIEVNEEGTEATAATMMDTCLRTTLSVQKNFQEAPPPPPPPPLRVDFVADHPFAFFVIEEVSGAILFAGHVLDPMIN